jgi:16S rRNA (uracil1498-N3)-methyltransferase
VGERRTPRVYIASGLAAGSEVAAGARQAHHLRTVLRLGPGAEVAAFNAGEGEWLCRVAEIGRSRLGLAVERMTRAPKPEPDLWLLFAPLKRGRIDWLVEKATELGVSTLLPLWTARTQPERVNLDRLGAHAVEAAEQCGRLSVPELRGPEPLPRVLAGWSAGRRLLVCDETGGGEPIAIAAGRLAPSAMAVLVGPEGGFDQTELDALANLSFAARVGLGPRVLRAETAALAALAVVQAIAGDGGGAPAR